MNELDSLVASAQALFVQSNTPADLENAKAQFLGKSGRIHHKDQRQSPHLMKR